MITWAAVPALRLALAFAIGISGSAVLGEAGLRPALLTLAATAAALLAVPVGIALRGFIRGAGVLVLALGAGVVAGGLSAPRIANAGFGTSSLDASSDSRAYYLAQLTSDVKPGATSSSAEALVWPAGDTESTPVLTRLQFASGTRSDDLGPGALLGLHAELQAVKGPRNPHTFDFRAYLRQRGIGYQAYVRDGDLAVLEGPSPPGALARLRAWIAQRIDLAFPTPREAGVARALLLGDRGGLDEQTRLVYTRTGAVHVLAVSGLHTGVIASILLWCLRALPRRRLAVVKLLLLWGGLFGYVALTGFSPSVQRSAVMFGVLFAGRVLRLDTNAFNSLGLSALLLLAFDPQLLFTLGFQLSYAAVAGILAFYPRLRRLFASPNVYLAKVGDLTAVSIAATLATAPITAYHFHQFPVYFILSGLLAVPLVMLALPAALGGLAVDGLCALAGTSAYWAYAPAYLLVFLCNASLDALAAMPGGLVEGLYPSARTAAAAFVAVVLAGAATLTRGRAVSWAAVAAFFGFGASVTLDTATKLTARETTVYATRHGVAVDAFQAGRATSYAPALRADTSDLTRYRDRLRADRRAHRAAMGALAAHEHVGDDYTSRSTATASRNPLTRPTLFTLGDLRGIVLPDSTTALASRPPVVDLVFVTDPRRAQPAELQRAFPSAQLLATDYLPSWRAAEWAPLQARLHVLPQDGAYSVAHTQTAWSR